MNLRSETIKVLKGTTLSTFKSILFNKADKFIVYYFSYCSRCFKNTILAYTGPKMATKNKEESDVGCLILQINGGQTNIKYIGVILGSYWGHCSCCTHLSVFYKWLTWHANVKLWLCSCNKIVLVLFYENGKSLRFFAQFLAFFRQVVLEILYLYYKSSHF